MKVLFAPCLLATTVAVGLGLQCEICGIGGTCNGATRTCDSSHDKCSITFLEITGTKDVQGTIKNCINSTFCNDGPGIVNMGAAGLIMSNLICCIGNDCKMVAPTVPERNITSNGKVCPACFALEKSCNEIYAYCAGDEIYCIEGVGAGITQNGEGTSAPNFLIKGCANERACEELQADSVLLPWATKESHYSCVTAFEGSGILQASRLNSKAVMKTPGSPTNAGATTTISELFGTFIQILAMKLFL